MKPIVSIVIPTYNRAHDLDRALKSVLAQTFPGWEALVVDNHSIDHTDDLVKGFNDPRIKLLKIHNQGLIAASRNLGIMHAEGEYIAFLDSDDWWTPKKLDESLKYLRRGADVVYHDLFLVKNSGQRFFWRKAGTRDLRSPVFDELIANGNALVNSSVVLRKTILEKAGSLLEDKEMNPWCDFSAWLKIAKHTEKFQRISKTLGYYWMGGGNVSSPEKTISVVARFECLYAADLKSPGWRAIDWINYAKGKAYYRMRSYELAKENLGAIRWPGATLLSYWNKGRWGRGIFLKSLYYYLSSQWMLLSVRFHHHPKT